MEVLEKREAQENRVVLTRQAAAKTERRRAQKWAAAKAARKKSPVTLHTSSSHALSKSPSISGVVSSDAIPVNDISSSSSSSPSYDVILVEHVFYG